MATVETVVVPTPGAAQPTLTITVDDSDNTLRWTDHAGTARSVPFTFANAQAIALCLRDGGANLYGRYAAYKRA